MKLSTKGRYAVMALVDLASQGTGQGTGQGSTGGKERPVTLAEIADRQDISLSYLEQLFAKLRRGGLVTSVRGPGGGYLLAQSAEETRISDVILAVDQPLPTTRCTPGQPFGCRENASRCLSHDLWEALGNQILSFLSSVSLADVVQGKVAGGDMLFTPKNGEHLAAP